MGQGLGRPLCAPHLLTPLLLPLLVLGCTDRRASRDSAAEASVDDAGTDTVPDAPGSETHAAVSLDAHVGLSSGASCDASAACRSGSCVFGTCSDWAYAMRITIDTTPAGADLRQAVTDFPLLVRLRTPSFDFRQASANGADVRFMDESGRTLGHQTERWDARDGVAEIWVSVPRIEPDRRDNVVLMSWGNPLAASLSSGPSVFSDLECTLHMDAASDGIAGNLEDASGKQHFGRMPNVSPSLPAGSLQPAGIAGGGLDLDGSKDYVMLNGTSQSPQRFAVSLWLKTISSQPASIAVFSSLLASGGIDRRIHMDGAGHLSFDVLYANATLLTVSSLTGYHDGAWHHVVARAGEKGQFLFVDGEPIADNSSQSGSTNNTGRWYFGAKPPPTNSPAAALPTSGFAGTLDEIRLVVDHEPSDDWIKLSYATQRPDAGVISYQAPPSQEDPPIP